jgi:hypothetical protein
LARAVGHNDLPNQISVIALGDRPNFSQKVTERTEKTRKELVNGMQEFLPTPEDP